MPAANLFTISAPTDMGQFHLLASGRGIRRVYWPGEGKGGSRQAEGGKKKGKATGLPQSGDKSRIESGMTEEISNIKKQISKISLPVLDAPAVTAKLLKITAKQLADYCNGRQVRFTTRLDLSGLSPFTRKVLRELAKVPYGKTITYGELAKRAGSAKAARAVGAVLANNPLPIIVPCHRVLGSDGSLGGFSAPGGLKLKRQLLLMEQSCLKKGPPDKSGG